MKGVTFKGQTDTLGKPKNMTDEECYALPIRRTNWNQYHSVESVWELTDEEIEHIKESKRIIVSALGVTHPPLSLSVAAKGGYADAPEAKTEREWEPSYSKSASGGMEYATSSAFNEKALSGIKKLGE